MALANLSVPSISISLAVADDPPPEPFSPFDAQASQPDSYRPSLLSPIPVVSPRFHRQPSPLRPAHMFPAGKGLESSSFEALLASTRERNASAKRAPDLRKELALKTHKSKQSTLHEIMISTLVLTYCSGTSRFILVESQRPSLSHRDWPSENSSRVAIYLPLFPTLPWPRLPAGVIRVFTTERDHRINPVFVGSAMGRTG